MTGAVDREELRGLFLFEALTDEQLDWLAQRGSRRVYDAAGRKGALLLVPGAGHNDIAERAPADYWNWFRSALEQ